MDRGFFPCRQNFPRRRGGHWFHQNNMPNENFWMDNWDMPQNQFVDRPPPQWNQHHPEQQRPYDVCFDNGFRGSYQRRPYRGRPYARSKKTFSRGRRSFQKPSSSSCLISEMSKKKSEKEEKQPEDSKEIKQDKGNTATSGKEGGPSKVKPKDSQPAEESPSQTASVASPGAATQVELPSGIAEVRPDTKNGNIALDNLKDCEATEDLPSQADPILSPGVSTEDKTSCSVEVPHNTEKEASELDNLKDCEATEDLPSQADPILSPGVSTEDKTSSCSVEVPHNTEKEASELDKLKDCEATEDLPSQADPILSPGVSTEDKTSSCSVEVPHNTEKEASELLQASESVQHSSHVCLPTSVEIPFLSENASDDQSERKEEIELTETSAKQNGTDHCQACVAPAVDSSSFPSTLSDIRCVPVLVREKKRKPYSWEADPFHAENQRGWAPEDYQEPPWSVNPADQSYKVSECYRSSESSVSSSMSSNGKLNVGRAVECKSSSPKNHHSSNSKHSSTNQTSSPSSHGRQEYSSRSSHKRERSTERQERSSKLSCRRKHSSKYSHRQEKSPQREKLKFKSSCRQEQSFQKQECSSRTSPMQEHSVRSTHKRKHSSGSPKRNQSPRSQNLDRWKEKTLGRGCCCHCCCQQSCSPSSREGSRRGCSPPPYLTCKIKCLHVSKEISKVYRMPSHHSSERSIANEKKTIKTKQLVEPKIIEKKKRETSGNRRKALKSPTRKVKASSPCHLNAEEKTSSSVPSKDHSADVLARKEEIEQAYLQVLLNFGVIAIMLVEKEPCMTETMYSALRTNLRKIGDYYESLLKNYIESLTEAS